MPNLCRRGLKRSPRNKSFSALQSIIDTASSLFTGSSSANFSSFNMGTTGSQNVEQSQTTTDDPQLLLLSNSNLIDQNQIETSIRKISIYQQIKNHALNSIERNRVLNAQNTPTTGNY